MDVQDTFLSLLWSTRQNGFLIMKLLCWRFGIVAVDREPVGKFGQDVVTSSRNRSRPSPRPSLRSLSRGGPGTGQRGTEALLL